MTTTPHIVTSRLSPYRVVVFAITVVIGTGLLLLIGFGHTESGWTGIALKAGSIAACGWFLWLCAGVRYRVVIDRERRCARWYSLRVPQGRELRLDDYAAYRIHYVPPGHYGIDGAILQLLDAAGKPCFMITLTSFRNGSELEQALGLPWIDRKITNKKSTR